MIKKTTLISLLLLTCSSGHIICIGPSPKQPSVVVEDITDRNESWGDDDENRSTPPILGMSTEESMPQRERSASRETMARQNEQPCEQEEKEAEDVEEVERMQLNDRRKLKDHLAAIRKLIEEERRAQLNLQNPIMAHNFVQHNYPLQPPKFDTIISESLQDIPQTCAVLIGSKVGGKIMEELTTDPSTSKATASTVDIIKLSLKLKHLNATSAVIHAKRAPIQEAIFKKLKEDAQNNNDTPNKAADDPEHDAHLKEVSMQEALRIEPLSPEERTALKNSFNATVNHLRTSLEKY